MNKNENSNGSVTPAVTAAPTAGISKAFTFVLFSSSAHLYIA